MNYVVQLLGWLALQVACITFAVALLLLFSLRLMRRAPTARRYRCAVMHLGTAVGAAVLSMIVSHASIVLIPSVTSGFTSGFTAATANSAAIWLSGLHDPSWPVLSSVGWIWVSGIGIAQALLAARLISLRRFIRGTIPAGEAVAAIVNKMYSDFGLSRPPHVRCADIRSPMVVGQRSIFLVVPWTLEETHIPAEVHALLAHELAHVLRRDYSRNILQLFAASLLWWHPGVWYIYARIRHERECACDEHAVRLTGSATPLAKALFHLASPPGPVGAVPIRADSGELADRISRILQLQGRRGRLPRFAVAALAALTALSVVASSTAPRGVGLTRAYASSVLAPPTVFTIRAHDPAGMFVVKMVRGRVVSIQLGQELVPSGQVLQRGDIVTVLGHAGQELLRVEVDPRGGLRWQPRRAS